MTKQSDNEAFVRWIQGVVGVTVDGHAGPATRRAVEREMTGVSTPAMKISDAGLNLIKEFEGCRLKAYPDPATGGKPWTIGYGHTKGVQPGDVITQAQADAFLREDVAEFERSVNKLAPITTQSQFDALVSFAFNLGAANLEKSTLLKKHRAGDYAGASQEFVKWNRAAGRVMAGLTRRRLAEAELYGGWR